METFKNVLLFPVKVATALVRIAGRIAVGAVGLVVMAGGLLLCAEPLHRPVLGIPLFLFGFLLVAKSIL